MVSEIVRNLLIRVHILPFIGGAPPFFLLTAPMQVSEDARAPVRRHRTTESRNVSLRDLNTLCF